MEEQTEPAAGAVPPAGVGAAATTTTTMPQQQQQQTSSEQSNVGQTQQPQPRQEPAGENQTASAQLQGGGLAQFDATQATTLIVNGTGEQLPTVLTGLQSQFINPADGGFIDLSSVSAGAVPLDPSLFPGAAFAGFVPGLLPPDALQQVPNLFPINGLGPFDPQAMDMSTLATLNMPANGVIQAANGASISEDEIALYDRQIRLWGIQAQQKIRQANVLLVTLRSLGTEVAKNLVLAGIASLTVVDGGVVTPADLGSGFFVSEVASSSTGPSSATTTTTAANGGGGGGGSGSILGTNRAQAALAVLQRLNPRVAVQAVPEDIRGKPSSFFAPFDVIIGTDLDAQTLNIVNTATRVCQRPFYAAGQHGMNGYIFSDLIEHQYVLRREAPNRTTLPGLETRTRSVVDVKTRKEDGGGGGSNKLMEHVTKRELYSTFFLAEDAPLPPVFQANRRRRRLVTPVLSCLRALWEFSRQRGGGGGSGGGSHAAIQSREDLTLFTRLATEKHQRLGLPPETLTPQVLRRFLQGVGCEAAPVAAILGGQLAQDVINVLGQTQQPIQNTVVFDGDRMQASMYALHPEGPLGAALFNLTVPATAPNSSGMDAAAAAAAAAAFPTTS